MYVYYNKNHNNNIDITLSVRKNPQPKTMVENKIIIKSTF